MKKNIQQLLCFSLVLLFSTVGLANDRGLLLDTENIVKPDKVLLDLSELNGDKATCTIYDNEGIIVFSEEIIPAQKMIKSYDLDQLSTGSYRFVLNDQTQTLEYNISKTTSGVEVSEKAKITFKPFVKSTKRESYLHLLALGKNVNINLLDRKGNLIYQETFENQKTISKKFNLQNTPRGEYTLKVRVGDNVYYEYINV